MKKNIPAIIERLKETYGFKSETEVASALKMTKTALYNHKLRGTMPYEALFTFCDAKHISLDWLLTGKGEPPHGKEAIVHKEGTHYIAGQFTKVDVFILAGAGNPKDLAEREPIDHIVIPHNFHSPSIIPIKIRGRSMEPLIFDGAYVGVDKEDREVISGEIYALWIPYEGAVIKRLFVEVDKIIVKSENPVFPTYPIAFKDIHNDNFILGRVKWIIQKL